MLVPAAIGLGAHCAPARAQPAVARENSQVEIAYVEASNANHRPIQERLQKLAVLEETGHISAVARDGERAG